MTDHTTAERPALRLTAAEAAAKSFATVAAMPAFKGKPATEIGAYAAEMMTRMIRTGHFVIIGKRS